MLGKFFFCGKRGWEAVITFVLEQLVNLYIEAIFDELPQISEILIVRLDDIVSPAAAFQHMDHPWNTSIQEGKNHF